MKHVRINPKIDVLLTELSKHRKAEGELNSTKQDIVGELVLSLHKKEIGSKNS